MTNPRPTRTTPSAVRLAVIRSGGNITAAARSLGVSDSTVRWHLKSAPPLKARVSVSLPPDTPPEAQEAVIELVRAALASAGVERWEK